MWQNNEIIADAAAPVTAARQIISHRLDFPLFLPPPQRFVRIFPHRIRPGFPLASSARAVLARFGLGGRFPAAVCDQPRSPAAQPLRRFFLGLAQPRLRASARTEGRAADVGRGLAARTRCVALRSGPHGEDSRYFRTEREWTLYRRATRVRGCRWPPDAAAHRPDSVREQHRRADRCRYRRDARSRTP